VSKKKESEEGFVQDFDLGKKQELYIYCRLCRRTYPVMFRPKKTEQRLRCICGNEAPLTQLDVFRTQKDAEEHAAFYERIYQAAKSALRDAGLPVAPSGKFKLEELDGGDEVAHSYDQEADQSDITASYVGPIEDSDATAEAMEERLGEFRARVRESRNGGDVLAYHDVLTDLVEWSWCRRHKHPRVMEWFLKACKEDIALASALVSTARIAARQGRKVKLTFSSFKHLILHLEEERQLEEAAQVADQAAELGLAGYKQRALDLRRRR
jgi:hypothetical protein